MVGSRYSPPQVDLHDLAVLRDLVLILAIALATVVVLRKLGVPAIGGLIVSGHLVGPNSLDLVSDRFGHYKANFFAGGDRVR